MLVTRPLLVFSLALLALLGGTPLGRTGGLREPVARRFMSDPPCPQQVAREQDFGVMRLPAIRKRPRC